MTPDQRERMYQLCALLVEEKDRQKFLELLRELNDLMEDKETLEPQQEAS